MWNITILKKDDMIITPQYEDFHDVIREAQRIANENNAIVSVHKAGGTYKLVYPQRKEAKCSTS